MGTINPKISHSLNKSKLLNRKIRPKIIQIQNGIFTILFKPVPKFINIKLFFSLFKSNKSTSILPL